MEINKTLNEKLPQEIQALAHKLKVFAIFFDFK